LSERWAKVQDAPNAWRRLPYLVLLVSLLFFGFFPSMLTNRINPTVERGMAAIPSSSSTLIAADSTGSPWAEREEVGR
jgi:hypothetical protein